MCRILREVMKRYMPAYKTTRYIGVLDKLVDNYNNSKHSTISFTPNEAIRHEDEIQKINTRRYKTAIQSEQHFKVGDKVRCIINLDAFEKHSLPKCKPVYTIVSRTEHSYTLSNGKTYKYYQLQFIKDVFDAGISSRTRVHQQIPTREALRKQITVKRKLKHENVDLSNIVQGKRLRIKTDRLTL